jgi:hypothetical protein
MLTVGLRELAVKVDTREAANTDLFGKYDRLLAESAQPHGRKPAA